MPTTETIARPRQFCCVCLQTVTEYSTLEMDDDRRFHFCTASGCQQRFTDESREYEPDEPPAAAMWCEGRGDCCDSDTWAPCGCGCHS